MSILTAISEVKNLPRTLFGFFRKEKGEGLNSSSADRIRAELNTLVSSSSTPSTTDIERCENALRFHMFSHLYVDKRMADLADNHFLNWLNEGDAYFKDPSKAYSFLTLLAPFNLLASSTKNYLLSPPPTLWGEEEFVVQLLSMATTHRATLEASGKTILGFLRDVTESLKSYHIGFWSFYKKVDNLLANMNVQEMSLEHKREAAAAMLTVASSKSGKSFRFEQTPEFIASLNKFLAELSLDRIDVSLAAVSLQLAGQWARAGYKQNGFGHATNTVATDPFKLINMDLPTLTAEEKRIINEAVATSYLANLFVTFGITKEFKSKSSDRVDSLLYTSLLDFREFPSTYKKQVRHDEASEQFLEQCVTSYLSIHTRELKDKIVSAVENSGIKVNKDYLEKRLSNQYNEVDFDVRILDNSEISKYIFEAYTLYLEGNINKYFTCMDGAKEFIDLVSPMFIVDISSIKKLDRINEDTRIKYKDTRGVMREKWVAFQPLELSYDFSEVDKKKLFDRILERQDMDTNTVIRTVQKYTNVCIIQKIINKVIDSKKNEIKFNLRDLNFGMSEESSGEQLR